MAAVFSLTPEATAVVNDVVGYLPVIGGAIGGVVALGMAVRIVRYFSVGARFDRWESTPGRYSAVGRKQAGF